MIAPVVGSGLWPAWMASVSKRMVAAEYMNGRRNADSCVVGKYLGAGTRLPAFFSQQLGDLAEIRDEAFELRLPRPVVGCSQNCGRVNGGEHIRCQRRRDELASLAGHPKILSQKRLSGGRSQADDDLRFHLGDLRFQPGTTRGDLPRVRLGMNSPLPHQDPFEVLHDVGDVDFGSV